MSPSPSHPKIRRRDKLKARAKTIAQAIRVKVTKRQIASIILAAALLVLNFTMRNMIWKKMQVYNTQNTQLEKLALAIHVGGQKGIEYEFGILEKYNPAQRDFLNGTSETLKQQKDPEAYLRASMAADRAAIKRLKSRRFILSSLIYLFIGLQALFNARNWYKDNRHLFHKPASAGGP